MVFTSLTRPSTSWAMSLSPVEITTSRPSSAARRASVPMTSSASTPSILSSGRPSACTASISGATCERRSSGMGGRCALYSAKISSRKVRARRVEDHRDQRRGEVLLELRQHVQHAEHRPGRLALRVRERRQRVEGPVEIRGAVHQHQSGRLSHRSTFLRPAESPVTSTRGAVVCAGGLGGWSFGVVDGGAAVAGADSPGVPAAGAGGAGAAGRMVTGPVFSGSVSGPL